MKNLFVLFLGLFLVSGFVFSQCTPIVSASSELIKAPAQRTKSNTHYWVCRGQSLILTGNNNTLYIEDSAVVNVQGDSNTINQRKNGTLTISGTENFVNIDPTSTFTDNATFTTKKNCPSMNFDYGVSPAGGCDWSAGIAIKNNQHIFSLHPVPARDVLYLELDQVPENSQLSVFSMDGKRHSQIDIQEKLNRIDVSGLTSGIYYIEIQSDDGRFIEKFVIE